MKENTLKRDIGIDLLKILAIFGVIIIHTCNYETAIASFDWTTNLFWRSLSGAAVPLFLMASGSMMLKTEKELTLKKLFFKNILRIVVAMVVWGIAYKAYHLIDAGDFTLFSLWHGIKEVFLFNQEFHFYYLHIILLVYAFLPITRIIIKSATKRQLEYLLLLWFLTGILYPTLKPFYPFNLFKGMVGEWAQNMTYTSIGYGILGYYLKRYKMPKWTELLFIISGFLIIFSGTYFMSCKMGYLYEHFLSGMGVGACFLTAGVFSLVNRVEKLPEKCEKTVSWVSKSTFCIYLVHMIVMYEMKRYGITLDGVSYIISIPAVAFINMAISSVIYLILSQIPVLKKWIV